MLYSWRDISIQQDRNWVFQPKLSPHGLLGGANVDFSLGCTYGVAWALVCRFAEYLP